MSNTIELTARDRFDLLPEKLQQKILDANRDWNTGHDWWDCVYESFREDMEGIGIDVDRMYFSGFWNQGDGACFDGRVTDWAKFFTACGITDPQLLAHAEQYFYFNSKQSGRYYHSNSMDFSFDLPVPDSDEDEMFLEEYSPYSGRLDDLRDVALIVAINAYTETGLYDQFREAFKDKADELYSQLEEEYEYLTSDEAILESLETNDCLLELVEKCESELQTEGEDCE